MPELVTAAVAGWCVFKATRFVGLRVVAGLEVINAREADARNLQEQMDNVPATYAQAGEIAE